MVFSIRFAIVCLAGILTPSLAQCPRPEFVKPACSCKSIAPGKPWVLCEKIASAEPIRRAMNAMEANTIGTFTWNKVYIEEPLPADFFHEMRVIFFEAYNSKFSFLRSQLPFEELETSLTHLKLVNDQGNISGMYLKHLKLLKGIYISQQNLGVLRKEWVKKYPDNLRILKMEQCGITSLEAYVFWHLSTLQELSLEENKITRLEKNMMPEYPQLLHTLNLNNNLLTNFPPMFFDGMSSLRRVYLFHNQITQLPFNPWALVWEQLEKLWLNENPINCTEAVKWICYERVPTILEGECTAPSRMVGLHLSALTVNFFD